MRAVVIQTLWLVFNAASSYSHRPSQRYSKSLMEAHVTKGIEYSFEGTSDLVYEVLNRVANHSWEWGAQSEVILEKDHSEYSVFSNTRKLPLDKKDAPLKPPKTLIEFLDPILARHIPGNLTIVDGDGAAGDPASLGTATLIAAATSSAGKVGYYQKLADDQLDWLLYHVPKTPEGAISHRDSELQFWSDYIYMAPPFLAYYGAQTSNITLMEIAYNQAKQYRTILGNSTIKVWQHIVNGTTVGVQDPNYWSTGNGWAASGMMRIYATFNNLRDPILRRKTDSWRKNLADWVAEIVKGAFIYQYQDSHLLPNYLANANITKNYPECSGTAMIAAAGYRLAALEPDRIGDLPMVALDIARVAIFTIYTNPETGAVAPVVDPLDWNSPQAFNGSQPQVGFVSPEGQAFTILMYEAWKAYIEAISCAFEKY